MCSNDGQCRGQLQIVSKKESRLKRRIRVERGKRVEMGKFLELGFNSVRSNVTAKHCLFANFTQLVVKWLTSLIISWLEIHLVMINGRNQGFPLLTNFVFASVWVGKSLGWINLIIMGKVEVFACWITLRSLRVWGILMTP